MKCFSKVRSQVSLLAHDRESEDLTVVIDFFRLCMIRFLYVKLSKKVGVIVNGTEDMSLDDINAEISATRKEKRGQ